VSDDKEFRAGAFSGLLAIVLVIALATMATTALNPATTQTTQTAQLEEALHKPVAQGVDSR
jgi:hypothetical protein